ncbi:MAG: sulfatase, partial [Bacteroidales bacterium]|nr:sulfatase [Bacteroidales bacterium]
MNKQHIAAIAAGLPLLVLPSCRKAAERPNIIFFLVDDFGWMDTLVPFGPDCYPENNRHDTPNFLQMAAEGTILTNAYAC